MNNGACKLKHYAAMFLCILLLLGSRRAVLVALAETRSEVSVAATNGTYHEVTYTQMPTLVPKESVPQIGSYSLLDSNGRICLKASMAVEYVVTYGKKTLYYNIHPSSTNATGACRENTSNLLLSFSGGNIEFTFLKKGTISYVSEIRADLQATPDCKRCHSEQFTGELSNGKLFTVKNGLSYKCNSERILQIAENLQIKITKLWIQAFKIINGQFGTVEECLPDYNKRIILLVVGGTVVGILLIVVTAFLIFRKHRMQGYERI